MKGLSSLSRRIDALQPQQEGGIWLVEDTVVDADEVKVQNCTLDIDGWYPRQKAIKMTKEVKQPLQNTSISILH